MSTEVRLQRRYDHRMRELVRETGNVNIALESGVPGSTASGWLSQSVADVVSIEAHMAQAHMGTQHYRFDGGGRVPAGTRG